MKNNLMLVLALCYGGYITKCFNPDKRAPFRYLLSSTNKVYDIELQNGFMQFYNTIFFSNQKELSLYELNSHIKDDKSKFVLVDMEERFDYFIKLFSDHKLIKRNIEIAKSYQLRKDPYFKFIPENKQNEIALNQIKKIANDIIAKKDYFMMNDI